MVCVTFMWTNMLTLKKLDAKVDYPAACNAMVSNCQFYKMMKHVLYNPVTVQYLLIDMLRD